MKVKKEQFHLSTARILPISFVLIQASIHIFVQERQQAGKTLKIFSADQIG